MARRVSRVLTSPMMARVVVMVTVMVVVVRGQGVKFSDKVAAQHIDKLSKKGSIWTVRVIDRFLPDLETVANTLDMAENLLATDYAASNLPNVTAYVEANLGDFATKLENAENLAASLGFNNTDDGLIAYMKSPHAEVNVGGHYDTTSEIFTVPTYGLYKILVRNLPHDSGFNCKVSRNGNETLIVLQVGHYYDVLTRVKLLYLNPGDQIYTTGSTPHYFSILCLRIQSLMPSFLDP